MLRLSNSQFTALGLSSAFPAVTRRGTRVRPASVDLGTLLVLHGLPRPEREYRFDGLRRWRFDLAFPQFMVAVELEGGVWVNGRHNRPKGFEGDVGKYNRAGVLGWLLVRAMPAMVRDGRAVAAVREALEVRGWRPGGGRP